MRHVVWDWNGTLLDDLEVVIASVNDTISILGADPITAEDYRRLYTRPVSVFYERMLARPITTDEWHYLDSTFHDAYRDRLAEASLASGAIDALQQVHDLGGTQSLLSMFTHEELIEVVASFGIHDRLVRIDGLTGTAGVQKHASMARHLEALMAHPTTPFDPAAYVIVGDALDDASAAASNGVACILFDSGSHHRSDLAATGYPVVETLQRAVDLAWG
ncbi:MAG: HAD hydrolase-like protein [Acidimicrobiia bacterium]|nr:HAD hydrolase-like protein [Acidimicrobiia bacterium]